MHIDICFQGNKFDTRDVDVNVGKTRINGDLGNIKSTPTIFFFIRLQQ